MAHELTAEMSAPRFLSNQEVLGKTMRYSLRSLMIAVLVLPPVLALVALPFYCWFAKSCPSTTESGTAIWDSGWDGPYENGDGSGSNWLED